MTVAELIAELQRMPQDAKVLSHQGAPGLGYGVPDPPVKVSYARQDPSGWWQIYWANGIPIVDDFEAVIIL